jgi:hypothetical protein
MKLHNRITRYLPDPDFVPAPRYLPPDPPEPRSRAGNVYWFIVGVNVGMRILAGAVMADRWLKGLPVWK